MDYRWKETNYEVEEFSKTQAMGFLGAHPRNSDFRHRQ